MLDVQAKGPVLYVTLNRPEVRNAFNDELISELRGVFHAVPHDIRAIVLRGNGKAFCAGGDLEWMRKASNYSATQNEEDAMNLARLFEDVAHCRPVVIAVVHGAAFGGGCGLVAAADVAIADPASLFAFSEVRLGLIPATISPFVIRKIGAGNARALFSTGEAFGAERALRIGLVHELATSDQVEECINAKLKSVLSAGPNAVAESKRLATEFPIPITECARRLAMARASQEGQEGVSAFLEKRKANFVTEVPE